MTVSDVLRPDGPAYDAFLQAEVGEDSTGSTVTVLSALARLGLEPWTEAKELARLSRNSAQVRLKAHLGAMNYIPTLEQASGSVATRLVGLLPTRAPKGPSKLPLAVNFDASPIPIRWALIALILGVVLARFIYLAQAG